MLLDLSGSVQSSGRVNGVYLCVIFIDPSPCRTHVSDQRDNVRRTKEIRAARAKLKKLSLKGRCDQICPNWICNGR